MRSKKGNCGKFVAIVTGHRQNSTSPETVSPQSCHCSKTGIFWPQLRMFSAASAELIRVDCGAGLRPCCAKRLRSLQVMATARRGGKRGGETARQALPRAIAAASRARVAGSITGPRIKAARLRSNAARLARLAARASVARGASTVAISASSGTSSGAWPVRLGNGARSGGAEQPMMPMAIEINRQQTCGAIFMQAR
jgi:hypothetical protein